MEGEKSVHLVLIRRKRSIFTLLERREQPETKPAYMYMYTYTNTHTQETNTAKTVLVCVH